MNSINSSGHSHSHLVDEHRLWCCCIIVVVMCHCRHGLRSRSIHPILIAISINTGIGGMTCAGFVGLTFLALAGRRALLLVGALPTHDYGLPMPVNKYQLKATIVLVVRRGQRREVSSADLAALQSRHVMASSLKRPKPRFSDVLLHGETREPAGHPKFK